LDIGITDGYTLEKLHSQLRGGGAGLDIAQRNVEQVREGFEKKGLQIDLRQGSITAAPFEDNFFDIVTACEILEHLDNPDLDKGLSELHRVLRLGGRVFITTPYRENVESSLVCCPDCGFVFHPGGHFQSFDESRAENLLRQHGFASVHVKKIYGTDFRLARHGVMLPLIKLAAHIFQVDSLTKLLAIAGK
jgi:2-polyprenyl-3-methyl-5-hydroxy-6-metoxy-1,4-benzoquinol methylase